MQSSQTADEVIDLTVAERPATAAFDSGLVSQRLLGLKAMALIGDGVAMVAAFVVLSRLRLGSQWGSTWDRLVPGWELLLPVALAGALLLWRSLGMYRIHPDWGIRQEMGRAVQATLYLAAATLAGLFLLDLDDVSRLLVTVYFEVVVLSAVAIRLGARQWFRVRRAQGKGMVHTLVLGSGPLAQRYLANLAAHPEAGVIPIGVLSATPTALPGGVPHLGTLAELEHVLATTVVDEVVVCLPFEQWRDINAVAAVANLQGKTVRIPVDMLRGIAARQCIDTVGGVPVLSLVATPDSPVDTATKRLLDIVGAAAALLVAAPAMAVLAILIKLHDGGPVLFSQERVGMHGRTFRLHKFRSMVVDAEARKAELEHLNERQGPTFKLTDDPRVTPVGRFIRKTSLDELPQLWNALMGEMSLVGPRPPLPSEVSLYNPWHRRRLSMKPGITGLWQISARDQPGFDSWVELDLAYIDTWTPREDLRILLRTIPAVLKGTGT